MIKRLFPQGKAKAFNISYDDGVLQDIGFVELLNLYGLKGTFNLNSGLMKAEFAWQHECGMTVKRLSETAARELYRDHEVASHTLTHPYMDSLDEEEILRQMTEDKHNLETLLGRKVTGFAVPFLYYSDLIAKCAQKCGFEYARISEESHSFNIPEDYYWWRGSKFHWDADLEGFVDAFLATNQELAFCQLVGHSYDLDVDGSWDKMERICRKIAAAEDVLPMTHGELVRYIKQMRKADVTDDCIINHGNCDLWFEADGSILVIHPGEEFRKENAK